MTKTDPEVAPDQEAATSERAVGPHALLAIAFGLAMVANFALTLLMGRMLDSSNFGTLGLLVAIFLFCSMPASAISVMAVTRTAAWASAGDTAKIAAFKSRFTRRTSMVGGILVIAAALSAPVLSDVFKVGSPAPIVLIAAAIAFWLILTVNRGVLQGMRLFNPLAASFVTEAVTRVGFAVIFVWVWRSATAAAAGILVSAAVSWLATVPTIRSRVGPLPKPAPEVPIPRFGEAGTVIAALAVIAWMQNADVFAIKASVPAWEAGQYVATATLGKAFFFFSLAAVTAMLPDASEARGRAGRLRIAGRASGLVMLMAIPAIAVAFVVPEWIVTTVYGPDRAEMATWLGPIVISSVFLSLTYLGANYLAAMGRSLYMPILALTGSAELLALLTVGERSIGHVVAVVIAANVIATSAMAIDAMAESRVELKAQGLGGFGESGA
ncbi:MAG: hypothetical protein DCC49_08475 [Acidobacteria bacterium]|nr:MAG: hypothetical protein DCC49_08475 [Acidobacteriota bacterium]